MVVTGNSDLDVNIFSLYRYRWSIERLFKHLKSSGFNIEKSHITNLERFCKLVAVCAIASTLIIKNGLIANEITPIKVRKSKDIQKQLVSFFTYGIDIIKHTMTQGRREFLKILKKIIDYKIVDNFNQYFNQISHNLTKL